MQGKLPPLHQKGEGLTACPQRAEDDLGALGDQYSLGRLPAIAQLPPGKPGENVQLWGGEVGDLNDFRHKDAPCRSFSPALPLGEVMGLPEPAQQLLVQLVYG